MSQSNTTFFFGGGEGVGCNSRIFEYTIDTAFKYEISDLQAVSIVC
jgi:hypothetical protein